MEAFGSFPTVRMSPPGNDAVQGEFPPIAERSIVAPDAGRLHRRRLVEGRPVKENGIVAELRRGDVQGLRPVARGGDLPLVDVGGRGDPRAGARRRVDPADGRIAPLGRSRHGSHRTVERSPARMA